MKLVCVLASAMLTGVLSQQESLHTMSPNPSSFRVTNPDGTVTPSLRMIGSKEPGSETGVVIQTLDEYTVGYEPDGSVVYLEEGSNGALQSSGLQVGKDAPVKGGKNLSKNIRPKKSPNAALALEPAGEEEGDRMLASDEQARRLQTWTGQKKNLMVCFRFSDHATRTLPSQADLTDLMNHAGPKAGVAPTGSVRDAFLQSSYNALTLTSTVTQFVQLSNTEAYYTGPDNFARVRDMIREALDLLDASGFDFRPFDVDNSGRIDAIGFLHSGYGAEWGGQPNRVWSHKWGLGSDWISNEGVRVNTYHVSPSIWGTSGTNIGRIGVIAHETGHFFGITDLYDNAGGSGLGSWGMMANSWGFDGSQLYPPPMSAWSKGVLGWGTTTTLSTTGSYELGPACSDPQIFKITHNYPSQEYLLLEYRSNCGFDFKIPNGGSGLLIWHIDDSLSNYRNEGFPGQSGWPTNGNHYRVAVLQADGNYNLEKGNNRGDAGDTFGNGVTSISDAGLSNGKPHPNLQTYKGGIVNPTGIVISNIRKENNGAVLKFDLTIPGSQPSPTAAPTKSPTKAPTASPTKSPTASPTESPTASPTESPTVEPVAAPAPVPVPAPVPAPAPVPVPAPTPVGEPSCLDADLTLVKDNYPGETSWSFKEVGGSVLASGSNPPSATPLGCLDTDKFYVFRIEDSYGDGMCCSYGSGSYNLEVDGTTVKQGGEFQLSEEVVFQAGSPASYVPVQVEVYPDSWPSEVSWTLNGSNNMVFDSSVMPRGKKTYKTNFALDPTECHTVTVSDTWGDGLTNEGHVKVYMNGAVVGTAGAKLGSPYGYQKVITFGGSGCASASPEQSDMPAASALSAQKEDMSFPEPNYKGDDNKGGRGGGGRGKGGNFRSGYFN